MPFRTGSTGNTSTIVVHHHVLRNTAEAHRCRFQIPTALARFSRQLELLHKILVGLTVVGGGPSDEGERAFGLTHPSWCIKKLVHARRLWFQVHLVLARKLMLLVRAPPVNV